MQSWILFDFISDKVRKPTFPNKMFNLYFISNLQFNFIRICPITILQQMWHNNYYFAVQQKIAFQRLTKSWIVVISLLHPGVIKLKLSIHSVLQLFFCCSLICRQTLRWIKMGQGTNVKDIKAKNERILMSNIILFNNICSKCGKAKNGHVSEWVPILT